MGHRAWVVGDRFGELFRRSLYCKMSEELSKRSQILIMPIL
ncbi:MAG: hypothetical protein RMX68_004930 [Aulosira sp. ZfuVER01]|nr:hypothetical protein [Aulosira sp. ZfuVER01]MDZ8000702.1 hypothetical protein [Aulosira sp. DedVER01a]MDZ8051817.1 hypothetical protein [Aulosira sp. ZfuCHP01]